MAKKVLTIVGVPLTPEVLIRMDAYPGMTSSNPFELAGPWTLSYQIWTCHGYWESGNETAGFLRISRGATGTDGRFTLDVHQELRMTGTVLNRIVAQIRCRESVLSCPEQWTVTSAFIDREGQEDKNLALRTEGVLKGRDIALTKNGVVSRVVSSPHMTCDWCVMESVQRMVVSQSPIIRFDLFETLETWKPDQQLIDRGMVTVPLGETQLALHRFDQMGRGILPFGYWIDSSARVSLATSQDKAYILDDRAEAIFRDKLAANPGKSKGDDE